MENRQPLAQSCFIMNPDKKHSQTIVMPWNRLNEFEQQSVIDTATADKQHGSYGLTHVVIKDGLPIGHLSIAGVPTVLTWMHTENSNCSDAKTVRDFYENKLREVSNSVIVPCMMDSPFYKYMTRVGYIEMKNMAVFMKGL